MKQIYITIYIYIYAVKPQVGNHFKYSNNGHPVSDGVFQRFQRLVWLAVLCNSCLKHATYWHMCKCCITYLLTYTRLMLELTPVLLQSSHQCCDGHCDFESFDSFIIYFCLLLLSWQGKPICSDIQNAAYLYLKKFLPVSWKVQTTFVLLGF